MGLTKRIGGIAFYIIIFIPVVIIAFVISGISFAIGGEDEHGN